MKNPRFGLAMTEQQYGENWQCNAQNFADMGEYDWMASQLGAHSLILEIGCGAGESTLRLAKLCKKVLVIESNDYLIKQAETRLLSSGLSVCKVNSINQLTQILVADNQAILVHDDIFNLDLEKHLAQFRFEAIVCWLIGSHPEHIGTHLSKNAATLAGTDMAAYREKIQRRAALLGQSCLVNNGLLHIVDRVGISSWNDKTQLRQDTQAQLQEMIDGYEAHLPIFRKIRANLNASQITHLGVHNSAPDITLVFSSSILSLLG